MHAEKQYQEISSDAKQAVTKPDIRQTQTNETTQCRFTGSDTVQKNLFMHTDISSKPNRTGMPDRLKSGLENLSGYDLSPVRVHYNSPKPKQIGALAYTQGTNIHIGPGQQKHLPHEGWHVIQQMQGRVKPTIQVKELRINNDKILEDEASKKVKPVSERNPATGNGQVIQCYTENEEADLKVLENKVFAVVNEGKPDCKLYAKPGAVNVELKGVRFYEEPDPLPPIEGMVRIIADHDIEPGELAAMHCGTFSKRVTGVKENIENETAPPGRSLFVNKLAWSVHEPSEEVEENMKKAGNWGEHYAPVIIQDYGDRGTFETAVHVDHAWFGIYGQKQGQTFRLKTVMADIDLALKRGLISEELHGSLLVAFQEYIETGSSKTEDEHLLEEIEKIKAMVGIDPDIDSEFRAKKERDDQLKIDEDAVWDLFLADEFDAAAVCKEGIERLGISSFRNKLDHFYPTQAEKLSEIQAETVKTRITLCQNEFKGESDPGLGTKLGIGAAIVVLGALLFWLNSRRKR